MAINSLAIERVSLRPIWVAVFLLILCIPIGIALAVNRDPWFDEAMLANNFVEMSLKNIADPMPLYEQVTSLGHVLSAKFVLLFAGVADPLRALLALRALSAAVGLVGILFFVRLAREESSVSAALTVAVLSLCSPWMIRYATEIKPHIFDFTATSIIVYAAAGVARSGETRDFVKFVVAAFFACLLSMVAVVPIVACLSAAGFVRVVNTVRARRRSDSAPPKASMTVGDLGRFVGFGGAAVLIALAFYVLYSRSATELQFKASSHAYFGQNISPDKTIVESVRILAQLPGYLALFCLPYGQFASEWYYEVRILLAMPICGLITVAFGFCMLRNLLFAMSLTAALVLVTVLNALDAFPIINSRHFLFLAPLLFLVISIGGVEGYRRIVPRLAPTRRSVARSCGISILGILYGVGSPLAAANLVMTGVSPLLSRIRHDAPEIPVSVSYEAQPSMRFLSPKYIRQVGLFDPASSSEPFMESDGRLSRIGRILVPNTRYALAIEEELRGQSRAWMLFGSIFVFPPVESFLAAAERAVGHCELAKTAVHSRLYFCSAAAAK